MVISKQEILAFLQVMPIVQISMLRVDTMLDLILVLHILVLVLVLIIPEEEIKSSSMHLLVQGLVFGVKQ